MGCGQVARAYASVADKLSGCFQGNALIYVSLGQRPRRNVNNNLQAESLRYNCYKDHYNAGFQPANLIDHSSWGVAPGFYIPGRCPE
jgi:hypothetical protein